MSRYGLVVGALELSVEMSPSRRVGDCCGRSASMMRDRCT